MRIFGMAIKVPEVKPDHLAEATFNVYDPLEVFIKQGKILIFPFRRYGKQEILFSFEKLIDDGVGNPRLSSDFGNRGFVYALLRDYLLSGRQYLFFLVLGFHFLPIQSVSAT